MYELMKYRGWHYDANMPALMFFHWYQLLVRDAQSKNLDPFLIKLIGKPDQKSMV